jgi:hypothetical protein
MRVKFEDTDEVKNIAARVRPYPISVKYELSIFLNSENDYFKCAEALMDTIGIYRYMMFEYNQFNINAVMQLPESNQFENTREKSLSSKNEIKLTTTFDVYTFYPGYRRPAKKGIRGIDGPNTWSNSSDSDSFSVDEQNIIIPKRTKWYSSIDKSAGNQANSGNIDSTNPDTI